VDYFISPQGSDKNPGGRKAPWKTLQRLSQAKLKAGDGAWLEGGKSFEGPLKLGKGHSGIRVGSYGRGMATIRTARENAVVLERVNGLEFGNLKLRGPGYAKMVRISGLLALACKRLKLHGVDSREFPYHGIFVGGGSDIEVSHCRAQNNGSAGICTYDSHGTINNLRISHCIAENNPGTKLVPKSHSGSGILVAGVKGAVIEYCRASRNGWAMPRKGNGPVGIWAWKGDKVLIQHCLSYGNLSPGYDGGGFDFDGGITNSVMQHNLSYGNIGCGYDMYQFPKAPRWRNNTLRFNISYMDGKNREGAGVHFWTGDGKKKSITHCRLIHNTIVAGVGPRASAIRLEEFQAPFPGLVMKNNIFMFRGLAVNGQPNLPRYQNNLWWNLDGKNFRISDHESFEAWTSLTGQETAKGKPLGSFQDPRMVLPKSLRELPKNVDEMAAMKAFRLKPGSPALGRKGGPNLGAWQGNSIKTKERA